MIRRAVAGLLVAGLCGFGAAIAFQNETTVPPPAGDAETAAPEAAADNAAAPVQEEPLPRPKVEFYRGQVTPMRERVAVLGLLNKRSGVARDLTMRPGQAVRVGNVIVRLRACEQTAPWEPQKLTGAFVQTDVRGTDGKWSRVFSGWLFKESPSLNVVEHPLYDVWPKSCVMRYPDFGPETVSASSSASSAKKSAEEGEKAPAPAPAETPSAASSNPT